MGACVLLNLSIYGLFSLSFRLYRFPYRNTPAMAESEKQASTIVAQMALQIRSQRGHQERIHTSTWLWGWYLCETGPGGQSWSWPHCSYPRTPYILSWLNPCKVHASDILQNFTNKSSLKKLQDFSSTRLFGKDSRISQDDNSLNGWPTLKNWGSWWDTKGHTSLKSTRSTEVLDDCSCSIVHGCKVCPNIFWEASHAVVINAIHPFPQCPERANTQLVFNKWS